jgi:YidC/Oxa1 family membrane protein insertase
VIPTLPSLSILDPLENIIHDALFAIHDHSGFSWAWSIIVLTIFVRIVLIPLTVKQMKSMQRMQQFQPEIKKLQEKHRGDKQQLNQEMMKFYRENKINPFGSCLPLVLQLPVFFALYLVLREFARNTPPGDLSFLGGFVNDITDKTTSVGWAGVVLIVAYVLSQMGSTLLMPATMDKTQRYLFLAMPLVFVFFVVNFPVGLMLYWITTNLWTVGQQATIRKLMPPSPEAIAAARESGGPFKELFARMKGDEPAPAPRAKRAPARDDGATPRAKAAGTTSTTAAQKRRSSRTPSQSSRRRRRS